MPTSFPPIPDCKHFGGYKPCFPRHNCLDDGCADPRPRGTRILIINLDALGNVLVTTSLLPAIKRAHPVSSIFWMTLKNAAPLLQNNPFIDRVFVWEPDHLLQLEMMEFDIVMNIDKSGNAGALAMSLNGARKLGYGMDGNGVIVPLNEEAVYNYRLGLDDHLKFRVNRKPNTQLLTEAMGLMYERDEYVFRLTEEELRFTADYRREALPREAGCVVGFNTGCSLLYPNKKMTIAQHLVLIERLSERDDVTLLLLGGPEDTERNAEIKRKMGDKVISTPTTHGIRKGMCYESLCDVVITGDSFGMHAAVALKKFVIVWFGVSCEQEIDLFGRGVKLIPEGLECSPCWKKECPFDLECLQLIDLQRIVDEVGSFIARRG